MIRFADPAKLQPLGGPQEFETVVYQKRSELVSTRGLFRAAVGAKQWRRVAAEHARRRDWLRYCTLLAVAVCGASLLRARRS